MILMNINMTINIIMTTSMIILMVNQIVPIINMDRIASILTVLIKINNQVINYPL